MPTWIYICIEHGRLFQTKRGKGGHHRRLACRPRKLRPGELRKIRDVTRAELRDEDARWAIGNMESWGVSDTEAERHRGARG